MASSNSAMQPDPLHVLNDLKVMIQAIQNAHEASTAGLRQSINDLEDLRTLLSSHEQKFSEILKNPIALREQTNNTGMIDLKPENRLDSLTNLESQLVSVKESVSKLCNDVEVATSQINEQDLTLNMLDARFDAMDYKVDARKSAELAMQGELQRMDRYNRQLNDDHVRLNKELGLFQSNVENARLHCSEEHKKSTQGELERLDSYNRQLRDEQVRLSNELHSMQSKVENAHLHCLEELKKSEYVLQAQIESNRNVGFFNSIHAAMQSVLIYIVIANLSIGIHFVEIRQQFLPREHVSNKSMSVINSS
ncbi:uncharacterized protein MELLADRAFT_68435 [Melampsora larici-populina 98AG31]|uniref:Uncharacterized protein n=1 Tax=Melampsora larici-populina (strain 98AG31 / pathotype 3-4-7) TaxID=747676 RepID=F4S6T7_MELLP|nr:uncharacterized protein MELLADRAFT_68435 [Melampsora larici-populina 98AG31]EGF99629.1 hypothetical protein MELLADRAFT_68435 [Melampsora larici-populina 98AG31]